MNKGKFKKFKKFSQSKFKELGKKFKKAQSSFTYVVK